jgi:hypothetical protein
MDIWKWVMDAERDLRDAGNNRLADLIESIPSDTRESRTELVEAAMPEALAGARAIKNPWLEVFFRHWGINNRMSDMIEGEKALPEVVSLLEFTHRDETITCPQAVCATQDIAMCYGNIDGPGWVAERLAVCEEALARINPEWPCFGCISEEYALALLDSKRSGEALQFLARQDQARLDAGGVLDQRFIKIKVRALCLEGKFDEALKRLDDFAAKVGDFAAVEDDDLSESDEIILSILRALILAEMQQYAEAWEAVPGWNDIKPVAYPQWAQAVLAIAMADSQYNSWQIGRLLQKSVDYLSSVGAHRHTVDTAIAHIELALHRNAHWTAQRALRVAQKHLAKLRQPQDLAPMLAALAERIAAIAPKSASLPVAAVELAEHLNAIEDGNPENDVQHLLQACKELPQNSELANFAANALDACGAMEEAKAHLLQFVRANPSIDGPNYQLLGRYLDSQDYPALHQLAKEIAPSNPSASLWFQAKLAFAQKRYEEACVHLAAYVNTNTESIGARDLWVKAALASNDMATALRLSQALANESQPDDDGYHGHQWSLLTIACATQDWPLARQTAATLELELQPAEDASSVIEEDWGGAYIEFTNNNVTEKRYAQRTGPVTARILTHTNAPDNQNLGDWVAFDIYPTEPAPEDEAEKAEFIYTYSVVHVIEPGGFGHSCFCDGASPGEDALAEFAAALTEKGWRFHLSSDDDYTVTDPNASVDDGEDEASAKLPGCYFQVAAPAVVTAKEIDATLRDLTAHWPHPMAWPRFADRAGLDLERHVDIVTRYDL